MEARVSAAMAAARNLRRQSRKEKQGHKEKSIHGDDNGETVQEGEGCLDQEGEGTEEDSNPFTETLSGYPPSMPRISFPLALLSLFLGTLSRRFLR